MTSEQWKLVQEVAATEARLCEIVVAADKLAEAIERFGERHFAIRDALERYKIARQGQ